MGTELSSEIKELMGMSAAEPAAEETLAEVADAGTESTGGGSTEPKQVEEVKEPATEAGSQEETVSATEKPAGNQEETDAGAVEDSFVEREKALLAEIDRLSQAKPAAEAPVQAPPKTVPVVQPSPQTVADTAAMFTDEAIQEAFGYDVNLEKVRALFRSLHGVAMEDALRIIPAAAAPIVAAQLSLQRMAEQFYVDNPDLEAVKAYVGQVGTELESKNPDWTPAKLFSETEKEVRARLKIKKASGVPTSANVTRPVERKPAFSKPGARVPEAQQVSGLSKEINELLR